MKINHLVFFARRYLLGTKQETAVNTMVKICFIGTAIGAFSLALVISIMQGFEKTTHERLQSINAQIIMGTNDQILDYQKIAPVLSSEFSQTVKAFNPCCTQNIILQDPETDQPTALMIKGIDPQKEPHVTVFSKKILAPEDHSSLTNLLKDNHIIIGQKLAQQFDFVVGSDLKLLFVPDEISSSKKISLDQKDAIVGGIFQTGIDEYDTSTMICSLSFLQEIFPNSDVSTIEMKLYPNVDEKKIISKLKQRFNVEVYSWKSMYPALVAALKLEKYAMFFILILITLVASMNMISLLFMLITHKQGDIAILRAMGMSEKNIANIFILVGMAITLFSSLFGLAGAFAVSLFLKNYPFITLPDIYHTTHLPIAIEWPIFVFVFIVVMIVGLLSSWIPSKKARKISIASILSFER